MPGKTIPEIVDLASAFYGSATLFAALDLGVFAAVAEAGGPVALVPLAERLGASPRGLRLLLDACSRSCRAARPTFRRPSATIKMSIQPGAVSRSLRGRAPLWNRRSSIWVTIRSGRAALRSPCADALSRSGAAWCR